MEPENLLQKNKRENILNQVTPLSKYLAMALFVALPFLGGWVGYSHAPVKVVERETIKYVHKESPETVAYRELSENLTRIGFSTVYIENLEQSPSRFLMSRDDVLYIHGEHFGDVNISAIPNVDIRNLEYIDNNYIRDNKNVYYIGFNDLAKPGILKGADPKSFEVIYLGTNNMMAFGKDKNALFFQRTLLEGIDPDTFMTKYEKNNRYRLPIIYDKDTLWHVLGSCSAGYYEQGEVEKLDEYTFPCSY